MERRSYNQYCGLAKALDVIGERWTLLIVRNLILGPLRYSDLQRGLPGITTNLLAKRLKEMEELELIERVRATTADGAQAYRLTALGAALEPAVHALGTWGWRWMKEPKKGDLRSLEWLLVALRRRYRGNAKLRVELVVDGVPYRMILNERHADISRGDVSSPDLRLRGSGADVARVLLEGVPRRLPAGIELEGSRDQLAALVGAFATEELEFGSPLRPAGG